MNISIFGLGYVGCVSVGCLAKNGHNVIGVDVADHKVNLINSGKPTIIEKDIDHIIAAEFNNGRISATQDYQSAVNATQVSIICVGTPSSPTGQLDLGYVYRVAEQIGEALKKKKDFHVVSIRSTVLPGTNEKVNEIIARKSGKKIDKDFAVVSNPEFLREGYAVSDFFNPPFTAIGTSSDRAFSIMQDVYKNINGQQERVDIKVAELIKYVNNTFHALKITFANEVGNICKKLNIDSHEIMDLFIKDAQLNISSAYLKPGFAYGGSCLPKDLKGLATLAHDYYLDSPVIESIERSNEAQKKLVAEMILAQNKKNIGIIGLSFKKDTDDLRYSPSVDLAEVLLGKGFIVRIFDENVNLSQITGTNKKYIDERIPHLIRLMTSNIEELILNSEVIVVTHNYNEFSRLNEIYPDKIFLDLIRVNNNRSSGNYKGISW